MHASSLHSPHRSSARRLRLPLPEEPRRVQETSSVPDLAYGLLSTARFSRMLERTLVRRLPSGQGYLVRPLAGAGVLARASQLTVKGSEKNKARNGSWALENNPRRPPTLPRGLPRSTIGAGGLNCRVRNGNGCGPSAKVTGKNGYEFSVLSFQLSVSSRSVRRSSLN